MAGTMAETKASRPIRRILVANRGEITRRVFRSAHAMGCTTVAVYADGDRHAPFVHEADLAVPLHGNTAAETYLDIAKLLAAAAVSGADAVHPGYGFLSENAQFAQAVIDAGLVWIGPPPEAIAAMGDKLAAKETMIAAGVPTLPSLRIGSSGSSSGTGSKGGSGNGGPGGKASNGGTSNDVPSEEELAAAGLGSGDGSSAGSDSDNTGSGSAYPLMVKASAGGGGKGMRIVTDPADLADSIAAARREAAGAFGDDTVFVERCLLAPRHVEVQVLGDTHGNLVHFFERECSVQRRHQKVIEEAPSPAVTPALRERLSQAALAAVGTLGYSSTGTVEFLLTGEGDDAEFFFLEINTRLQVEHPVTEAITGFDLVREQIRIAAGEPLGYSQDDLSFSGWAVEARLYAEDPRTGFLPSTGTLDVWVPAEIGRFDSGVEQGSVIGTEFDPMLAKVIKHAPTRNEAALGLALALERTRIGGVVTNRDFLVESLRHEEFLSGRTDTDFIERTGLAGNAGAVAGTGATIGAGASSDTSAAGQDQASQDRASKALHAAAAAVVLVSAARNRRDATALVFMPTGYRNSAMPAQELPLAHGDQEFSVSYKYNRDKSWQLSIGTGNNDTASNATSDGDPGDSNADGGGTGRDDGANNTASTGNGDPGSASPGETGAGFTARIIKLNMTSRNNQIGHNAQTRRAGQAGRNYLADLTHSNQPAHTGQIDSGHIDGGRMRADIDVELDAEIAGLRGSWRISAVGDNWYVDGPAGSVSLVQRSRFPALDSNAVEGGLTAPMPGKIILVDVAEGDSVTAGQVLLVMEAMKMEHQIAATGNGTVTEVRATVGGQVDNGELLVVISAGDSADEAPAK